MAACGSRCLMTFRVSLLAIAALIPTVHGRLFTLAPQNDPDNPCILLDTNFAIEFRALRGTDIVGRALISDGSITRVDGICNRPRSNFAVMSLILFGAAWVNSFIMDSDGNVELERSLQFTPSDVFANDPDVHVNKTQFLDDPRNANLSNANFSYQCGTSMNYRYENSSADDLDYVAEVTIFNIRVQAFNVDNGTFSPSARCSTSGTVTTTAVTVTTSTIATTALPAPKKKKYEVRDGSSVCIVLEAAFRLSITYVMKDGSTNSVLVNVPENATATGSCNQLTTTSQSILISFFEGWSLEMVFSKDTSMLHMISATAANKEAYYISNMTLTYKVDERFPNIMLPRNSTVVALPDRFTHFPRKGAGKSYYMCESRTSFSLEPKVEVVTTEFKFKAFNEDDSNAFTGSAYECSADEDSDDNVPVVVGCTVGGLILVIILGVVVVMCRKKKWRVFRQDYQII